MRQHENHAEPRACLAGLEGGFALPAALLVLMVLSVLVAFFLTSSGDQQRAGRALRESARAFYAADAGINKVFAEWDSASYDTLMANGGDSVDLGWRTLDNGSTYRAVITRTDPDALTPYYSLAVTGVGAGPFGGQRTLYVELEGRVPNVCCPAAVSGGGSPGKDARLDELGFGGVTMSGIDTDPAGWGPTCTDDPVDKPGLIWPDSGLVDIDPPAVLVGSPDFVEDTTITTASLYTWGSLTYDDLVAMATITLPNGSDIAGGIGPTEAPPGTCKTSDDLNWGDPLVPGSPCWDHFPIIHVPGDIRIRDGTGYGQGILLVDGELRIEDTFDFYGIIMAGVKDPKRARFEDHVTIHGGIIGNGEVRFDDGAYIQYSACAIKRALLGVDLLTVEPLDERFWRQAM